MQKINIIKLTLFFLGLNFLNENFKGMEILDRIDDLNYIQDQVRISEQELIKDWENLEIKNEYSKEKMNESITKIKQAIDEYNSISDENASDIKFQYIKDVLIVNMYNLFMQYWDFAILINDFNNLIIFEDVPRNKILSNIFNLWLNYIKNLLINFSHSIGNLSAIQCKKKKIIIFFL
jgi:hypothetical protein